jgi:hypothetical protein
MWVYFFPWTREAGEEKKDISPLLFVPPFSEKTQKDTDLKPPVA